MQKKLNATLQDVSVFSQQLEQQLTTLDINDRTSVVLAVQELLVNIVEHGYSGEAGEIELKLQLSETALTFDIEDYSENEFSLADRIDPPDPLQLPESGLGLFIISQVFDEVNYEHASEANRWHLMKKLKT